LVGERGLEPPTPWSRLSLYKLQVLYLVSLREQRTSFSLAQLYRRVKLRLRKPGLGYLRNRPNWSTSSDGTIYSVPVLPLGGSHSCGAGAVVPPFPHPCWPPQVVMPPDGTTMPNPDANFLQAGCETGFNTGNLPGQMGALQRVRRFLCARTQPFPLSELFQYRLHDHEEHEPCRSRQSGAGYWFPIL